MYEIMTPGPTQVRENVLAARSLPCTNPDLDPDFYTFYKETCELISALLHTKNEALILGGEGILGLEAACAGLTEPGDRVLVIDNGVFGKGFADFCIGCGIDSTCTVIQNQHLWFLQQCSCDTEALFLAAGYVGSALLDVGVVALRHPVDKFIGAGKTADTLALFFRSIFITPAKIVENGTGKQHIFL